MPNDTIHDATAVETQAGNQLARVGVGSVDKTQGAETQTAAAIAHARAALEIQMLTARKFPRNPQDAYQNLMEACTRPAFAEECEYAFPRGGTTVSGPSVYLAREAKRFWKNLFCSKQIIRDDANSRQVRVTVWDLETNNVETAEAEFGKKIYRKEKSDRNGKVYQQAGWIECDERELRELTNKQTALLERNCVFLHIPKDYIDDAVAQSRKTMLDKDAKDPAETMKKVLLSFKAIGVAAEQLEKYLEHRIAQSSPAELGTLRGIYKSIKDGNSTWLDYVNKAEVEGAELKAKTEGKTEELKEKIKTQKEKKETKKAEAKPAATEPIKEPVETAETTMPTELEPGNSLFQDLTANLLKRGKTEAEINAKLRSSLAWMAQRKPGDPLTVAQVDEMNNVLASWIEAFPPEEPAGLFERADG